MTSKDDVQRYLDAGIAFTNLTRAKAEELVGELVAGGIFPSGDARAKVDELIDRSRKGSELLVAQVRAEVTNQLHSIGITGIDDLAREVATLIGRTADAGKAATAGASAGTDDGAEEDLEGQAPPTAKRAGAPKTAAATTSAAKKTAAKKTAAKKAPATKAAATKSGATKASAAKKESATESGASA